MHSFYLLSVPSLMHLLIQKLFPHVKACVAFLVSLDATGIGPGIKKFICVKRLGARPRGRRQCGVGTKRNVGLSKSPRRIGDGPGQIQTAAVALRRERSIPGKLGIQTVVVALCASGDILLACRVGENKPRPWL